MPAEQIPALERRRAQLRSQLARSARCAPVLSPSASEDTAGQVVIAPSRATDPGRGPVLSPTRTHDGKTVTRLIPPRAEAETRTQIAECRASGN